MSCCYPVRTFYVFLPPCTVLLPLGDVYLHGRTQVPPPGVRNPDPWCPETRQADLGAVRVSLPRQRSPPRSHLPWLWLVLVNCGKDGEWYGSQEPMP